MATIQDVKDKMTQLTADVETLKAAHASGVIVPQVDLDALAASIDTVDASVKAMATAPGV